MILELNGIDVDCIIGERADERNRLQNLRVDVRLDICGDAAESDELSGTVLTKENWMTIFSRDVHPENGAVPMVVTPPGMEML